MKLITYPLALLLVAGASELKVVPPKDDTVLTDPRHREDFVTLASRADAVVRVKEVFRSTDDLIPVVFLEVVETIAGSPVSDHVVVAASIWDVIAPSDLRREKATFLLMLNDDGE